MAKLPPPTKRGPPAPLSGSSSEGENSEIEDVPPLSPCSSTSSGPVYVRPAGFQYHAQQVKISEPIHRTCRSLKNKKKIKKTSTEHEETLGRHEIYLFNASGSDKNNNNNNNLSSAFSNKIKQKAKKDPLPMKLRALPQSFWQQPNSINAVPPGSMYTVLPPVSKTDQPNIAEIADVRPVTPVSDEEDGEEKTAVGSERREGSTVPGKLPLRDAYKDGAPGVVKPKPKPPPGRIVRVSPSGSNLLAKLFNGVDGDKKCTTSVRRGRPKRDCSRPQHNKHLLGEDPYMIDAVDNLLPMLSNESNQQSVGPTSRLSVVSVKDGDKTLSLPSLSVEPNYTSMLSELVKAL